MSKLDFYVFDNDINKKICAGYNKNNKNPRKPKIKSNQIIYTWII